MAVELTPKALLASEATGKTPVIVLKFDGLDTLFGPVVISKYIRIGDPELYIGDDWVIGGTRAVLDQAPYVELTYSTTTIRQQIEPDRESGSSISSMKIRLIDYRQEITALITPGNIFTEPLGLRATVYFGFQDTGFPDDYVTIFKGVTEGIDTGAGWVEFSINHPDELKRITLFDKFETNLNGAINSSTTTILLNDASGLILPADDLRSFVQIDDEFVEFTGVSGNNLTGVTRGALLSYNPKALATAHDDDATIEPFYILEGNTVELALKMMLSQGPTNYVDSLEIESFQGDQILFQNQRLVDDYNVTGGDFITVTGSGSGNNLSDVAILTAFQTDDGTIIEIDGASFTTELGSSALAAFKSKYNVLPVGAGMLPIDVDIARHEDIESTFLAGYQTRHYITPDIKFKDFLEQELYNPVGMFSLPRQGKASAGLHVPPLPGNDLTILNQDNIKSPSQLVISRSMNRNFQNAIVYKIDKDLYEDKFRKGIITTNIQSIDDIGKRRDYAVDSNGLRSDLQGETIATSISNRRLERYKRGSEYLKTVKLTLKDGMKLEPGDVIVLDPAGLSLSNTLAGNRDRPAQFWEVVNREFNLKGEVKVDLVQTNYDSTNRYCQISPASYIETGTSTQVVISSSFQSVLGSQEYRKWDSFVGSQITVRNLNFTVSGNTTIQSIDDNVVTFGTALAFTPLAGYLMTFSSYDAQDNVYSDKVKLIYGFATDGENLFADGGEPYRII